MGKETAKAKAASTQNRLPRTDIFFVPYTKMRIREGFNKREDYGDIRALADSILAAGEVLETMHGYKEFGEDFYYVSEGHRRFTALKLIYDTTGQDLQAPFRMEKKGTTDAERYVAMYTRNSEGNSKHFTVMEQAALVKELTTSYPDNRAIAAKLGVSAVYIGKLLTLINGPEEIIKLVRSRHMTGTYAIELIQKGKAEEFIEKVKSGKLDPKKEQGEIFGGPAAPTPSAIINAPASSPDEAIDRALMPQTKQATITKKKVEKAGKGKTEAAPGNSWTILKKWMKNYEGTPPDPSKAQLFAFLGRVDSGEYDAEKLTRYFNTPPKRK